MGQRGLNFLSPSPPPPPPLPATPPWWKGIKIFTPFINKKETFFPLRGLASAKLFDQPSPGENGSPINGWIRTRKYKIKNLLID